MALRAAATVLTAQSVLAAIDRLDLAVYVAFGAFASAYGGSTRSVTRWRIQLVLGALLTSAVVSGALVGTTSHRSWLVLAIASGWAVVGSTLSQRHEWRPPGPLFLVFAAATPAVMATSATDVLSAGVTTAATASLAIVLGLTEVRVVGAAASRAPEEPLLSGIDWRLVIACGAAALTAGSLATVSNLAHPSWAMVAAVAPLSVAPLVRQLVRGMHRIIGTGAGLGLAALLLAVGPLPVILLIIVVTTLHAATELLVSRHYGLALFFITPLALLLTQLADPRPAADLLASRIVETVVGVGIGLLVGVLAQSRTRDEIATPLAARNSASSAR